MFRTSAVVTLLFSVGIFAATPTSKIDDLWIQYNQVNDGIEKTFKQIRMSSGSNTPIRKYIEDKKNQDKIRKLIEEAWKKEIHTQFSEKEIAYLVTLYSHPMFKKLVVLNNQFWSKEVFKHMGLPEDSSSKPAAINTTVYSIPKK